MKLSMNIEEINELIFNFSVMNPNFNDRRIINKVPKYEILNYFSFFSYR